MGRVDRGPGRTERTISWVILGALVMVACAVFIKQSRYDPTTVIFVSESQFGQPLEKNPAIFSDLSQFLPDNLEPAGSLEHFGSGNLADKINGKAELYFSSGFLSLITQRFHIKGNPLSWFEFFVYDMGGHQQAFAVYSMQKRDGADMTVLRPFSYRTSNAIFFIHGQYYVESVGSISSGEMMDAMMEMAARFVEKTPVAEDTIEEIALFPEKGLKKDSVAFLVSDAFGFQGLDHIFTATYERSGREVTVFLSKRKSDDEAKKLVMAYHDFLTGYGGKTSDKVMVPDGVAMDMLGDVELFFSKGPYFAGIRETDDWDLAEETADTLLRHLGAR
jgi:hypothetical protein